MDGVTRRVKSTDHIPVLNRKQQTKFCLRLAVPRFCQPVFIYRPNALSTSYPNKITSTMGRSRSDSRPARLSITPYDSSPSAKRRERTSQWQRSSTSRAHPVSRVARRVRPHCHWLLTASISRSYLITTARLNSWILGFNQAPSYASSKTGLR
jgi:hypothetical protein